MPRSSPEDIREQKEFPTFAELSLIDLKSAETDQHDNVVCGSERYSTQRIGVYVEGSECPEPWVVRAIKRGKLHTPKHDRTNRPRRLAGADVQRLITLEPWMKAHDNGWVVPNTHGTGPSGMNIRCRGVSNQSQTGWAQSHRWATSTTLRRGAHGGVRRASEGGTGTSGALTS